MKTKTPSEKGSANRKNDSVVTVLKPRLENAVLMLPQSAASFSDEDIRDYAYHLYLQCGRIEGRDVADWLEAKACLESSTPVRDSHMRLHRHRLKEVESFTMPDPEAENLSR